MPLFDGTVRSLAPFVGDAELREETTLAALIHQYEQTLEARDVPDRAVLALADEVARQRLQGVPLTPSLAFLCAGLTYYTQQWEWGIAVLQRLRDQGTALYETAWAWWHQVDFLALAGKHPHVVVQQRLLLEWVTRTLPTNHRLFSIADGTQAMSWRIVGQHQEWDDWCRRLLVETPATADTRWDRFFALRTQTVQALLAQDIIHATHHIAHLEELTRESADGELDLEVQAVLLQFPTVDGARVQQIGEKARTRWESLANAWNPPTTAQRRILRRLAHNLGAGLFRSRFYDLALPLLQHAADLGSTTATTYEWLADCLRYEQHDTDRIPALLEQAAARR